MSHSPPSAPPAPRPFAYDPPKQGPEVIFADAHILVLNKPAGLLTVAGKTPDLADCVESRAQQIHPTARIIHRLDKDTSGLIVLGLTAQDHAHIGLQFEKRQTRKSYIALVWGNPKDDSGHIDEPMHTDWPNRPKQHICYETGRSAQTDWQVLEREADHTRVLLTPHTGRTHQLRLHMAHIGHPILGDNLYAHDQALAARPRLCLHAHTLEFTHPQTGETLSFKSPAQF